MPSSNAKKLLFIVQIMHCWQSTRLNSKNVLLENSQISFNKSNFRAKEETTVLWQTHDVWYYYNQNNTRIDVTITIVIIIKLIVYVITRNYSRQWRVIVILEYWWNKRLTNNNKKEEESRYTDGWSRLGAVFAVCF